MSGTLPNGQQVVPIINFNEIPPAGELLVPGVYVEVAADYSNVGLLPFPARILVIGQMYAGSPAGNATPGQIYTIYRKDQGAALFGAASPLADMLNYLLLTNPGVPIDAVGLTVTGSNTQAVGTLTFSGAAKWAATQAIGLCGFRVPFTIQPTDTPSNMATNFVAAANGIYNAQNLPVNLAASGTTPGLVTITAILKGAIGNQYDLRLNPAQSDQTVPGVSIAITPIGGTSGGSAPGTGIPDITPVMSAISQTWYTDIVCCFNDATSLGIAQAALAARYTAMSSLDSTWWYTQEGTQGQLAAGMSGLDSQFMVNLGFTNGQDPTWRWASSLCGVAAQALLADPARQLRGLVLPGIIAPNRADRFMEPAQNNLLMDGVATYDVDAAGNVLLNRVVSNYTQSNLGVPDTAWQDIMTAKVMTRIRWDWRNYLLLNYPRAKLAQDDTLAAEYDPSIATPRRLQASWAARCTLYERLGWIENSAQTSQQSVFYIDPSDKNRCNSQRYLQIIGNNMIDAEQLLFAA